MDKVLKKWLLTILVIIGIGITGIILAVSLRYEYYITGEDAESSIKALVEEGQTFTASTTHKVNSIKVYINRLGSPATSTLEVWNTDGGYPTGSALTSATFNGNEIGATPAKEWKELSVSEITITNNIKYAITLKSPYGDDSNKLNWWIDTDGSGGGYTGGNHIQSTDGGSTWNVVNASYDCLFQIYGNTEEETTTISTSTAGIFGEWYNENYKIVAIISGAFASFFIIVFMVSLSKKLILQFNAENWKKAKWKKIKYR